MASIIIPTGNWGSYGMAMWFRFPSDTIVTYSPESSITLSMKNNIISFYTITVALNGVSLGRSNLGTLQVIANNPFDVRPGQWHSLEVSIIGDYIFYNIDGHDFPVVFDDQLRGEGGTTLTISRIRTTFYDDIMKLY